MNTFILLFLVAYFGVGFVLGYTQLLRSYDRNPEAVAAASAIILAWLPIGLIYIVNDMRGNLDESEQPDGNDL